MKIYTRAGDTGETGLFGGQRVAKVHPRVEAYGTVDELNALLGLAAAELEGEAVQLQGAIQAVQARLFDLGADLATPDTGKASAWLKRSDPAWSQALEAQIDTWDQALPALTSFILPGGSRAAASLHLARTVCRRAERRSVAAIDAGEAITPAALTYLNRLSDWLFTAARMANQLAGVAEQSWSPERD